MRDPMDSGGRGLYVLGGVVVLAISLACYTVYCLLDFLFSLACYTVYCLLDFLFFG